MAITTLPYGVQFLSYAWLTSIRNTWHETWEFLNIIQVISFGDLVSTYRIGEIISYMYLRSHSIASCQWSAVIIYSNGHIQWLPDLSGCVCFSVRSPRSLWSHVSPVYLMIRGLPVLVSRDAAIRGINKKKDKQTSRGSHVVAEPEKAAGSSS